MPLRNVTTADNPTVQAQCCASGIEYLHRENLKLQQSIAALRANNKEGQRLLKPLLAYFMQTIAGAFDLSLDGALAQEIAVELGLCVEDAATEQDCDEGVAFEPGDVVFRIIPAIRERGSMPDISYEDVCRLLDEYRAKAIILEWEKGQLSARLAESEALIADLRSKLEGAEELAETRLAILRGRKLA